MEIFSIILSITGLVLLGFAYKIYFKKSYHLINGFEKDYKKGLKDENYAIRLSKVYVILGFLLFFLGLALYFHAS
ncbi:hypothetical protein [Anaerococcus tetradius]|uniref:DUF3784 domain-containing protein n=1 Tax=Anaerococcus tetradius ATCC 35098 TaxID=525255 RepID=C2CF65_9FIRM|nr:hypothetical protein [Anaerococcus tetradius]EEI83823.1 hypothetical protein HMPREF0077_0125 [Anaerococcus tetradius ATCC 35098]